LAKVERKAVAPLSSAQSKEKRESSKSWKEEEARVFTNIRRSEKARYTVAVFCGGDGGGDNDDLQFWLGDVVRCGGAPGSKTKADGLVHRAASKFQSGGTEVGAKQECVKVAWWGFKQRRGRVGSQLVEYKQEGSEQWLLLSSVLPVDVAVSAASNLATNSPTLKISAETATSINEDTTWVLSQRGEGGCKRGGAGGGGPSSSKKQKGCRTVAQLKELCKAKGLPVGGLKAELEARLEDAEAGGAEEEDPAPPPAKKRK
jgi:hypothetical protein